uniref:Uncharacterized protein n=1 Tax=Octopus bimaculoides TaxID=37653 RepID=A0A0L8G7L1_OCTBM
MKIFFYFVKKNYKERECHIYDHLDCSELQWLATIYRHNISFILTLSPVHFNRSGVQIYSAYID